MRPMRTRRSNEPRAALAAAGLLACTAALMAQTPAPPPPSETPVRAGATDTLHDALTCRTSVAEIAGLLPKLKRERPDEFVQTERQYSSPMMDLYRLAEPVHAWGHASDAVVITSDRVLLLVDDPLEQAAAQLERALEQSRDAPLSGALDEQHALVVYAGEQPGLQGRTLIGCEYRVPGLSLLVDPADVWRAPTP